jgi:hypothetical protein
MPGESPPEVMTPILVTFFCIRSSDFLGLVVDFYFWQTTFPNCGANLPILTEKLI